MVTNWESVRDEMIRDDRALDSWSDREQDIDMERDWQDSEDFRRGGYE